MGSSGDGDLVWSRFAGIVRIFARLFGTGDPARTHLRGFSVVSTDIRRWFRVSSG